MIQYRLQAALLSLALIVCLVSFQNCGSFRSMPLRGVESAGSVFTPNKTSVLLIGSTGYIKAYRINHMTDEVTLIGSNALSGQKIGWIAPLSDQKTILASDSAAGMLNVLSLDEAGLIAKQSLAFPAGSVHLSVLENESSYSVFSSSYNAGKLYHYELPTELNAATAKETLSYSATAHTHSSTIDKNRGLVYVANLDEEKILVYRLNGGSLVFETEIAVADPRMIVYDEIYDRLFVTTETYSGPSSVKIFSITDAAPGMSYSEVGSFNLQGKRGAALKIDHSHGFAIATRRETGIEGTWAIPLTANGLIDSSRQPVFMPALCKEARSLEVSDDGKYYVVSCNDAANLNDVVVLKVTYDAQNEIVSNDVVTVFGNGAGGILSSALLSIATP